MYRVLFSLCAFLVGIPIPSGAQPESLHPDIQVEEFKSVGSNAIRIAKNPADGLLYYLKINGGIFALDPDTAEREQVGSPGDHGIFVATGFAIADDGTFFVVGNPTRDGNNIGIVKRGEVVDDERVWTTVAETEPYAESGGRDHKFNAIEVAPDGAFLLVNSGSRTDHGERLQQGREYPVTSAVFRLPIDAQDLILPNDEEGLKAFLYADGMRNSFDMAFAPNGDLFALENSDTRDNPEELNWIRQGHHFGFPWRIGTYDNPQQFPDFDPPDSDPLLVEGINMEKTFHNDPDFPRPPDGVVFTDPVLSVGPDADRFRDPVDGLIKDSSDTGVKIGTFTPHSSPLGLVFDVEFGLGGEFTGDGFCLSFNASHMQKYKPFDDEGEDLLHLELTKIEVEDRYEATVTRLVRGFNSPVDVVLVGNKIFVIEFADDGRIWVVSLPPLEVTLIPDVVDDTVPQSFALSQNYPNPFNSSTVIGFALPTNDEIELSVYNLAGQKVVTLLEGPRQAGTYTLLWEGMDDGRGELASGVYLYRLLVRGKEVETRKLSLLR